MTARVSFLEMSMTKHKSDEMVDESWRIGDTAYVAHRDGYAAHHRGHVACILKDTGNGFIAHFQSDRVTVQDHYVCLDYSQARDLVLAFSEFKKTLGFSEIGG